MVWHPRWQTKSCANCLLRAYFVFSTEVNTYVMTGSSSPLIHQYTHMLKKTKLPTKLHVPALPNPAGAVSAVCHEMSIEFTGFWYLNKSLKSGTHWEEQYLHHAASPIAYRAKFEISVYWSRASTEGCQHSKLKCVQKPFEKRSKGKQLKNTRPQMSFSQYEEIKYLLKYRYFSKYFIR